jgi:hypothetical protein
MSWKKMQDLRDQVESLIRVGADSLFAQHCHSIGYLLGGADDIVETNIVLHIGSALLSQGHAVWAESPFKVDGETSVKHMDLIVDLHPSLSDAVSALLVEAKRLRSLDGTGIVRDIIEDCLRIEGWPHRLVGQRPIFFEFTKLERVLGAIVVLLPDEMVVPNNSETPLFSHWWMNLAGYPAGFDRDQLDELKQFLEPMKRGICLSPFVSEDVHQVVVYALSDRQFEVDDEDRLTAKHEAAHVDVAHHFGLPVRHVAIEDYEKETDTALNGRMYCDWESIKGSRDSKTLCTEAFAVAFAGTWIEAIARGWSFDLAFSFLLTDQRAAAYIHQRLSEWEPDKEGLANCALEEGKQLALDIVQNQMARIERLADHLVDTRSMEEEEISAWFKDDIDLHG